MEQTEKQIKSPNERNLLQTNVTKFLFHQSKSVQKQRWMESENKKMEQIEIY